MLLEISETSHGRNTSCIHISRTYQTNAVELTAFHLLRVADSVVLMVDMHTDCKWANHLTHVSQA